MDGYQALGNAVVLQAARDWRSAMRTLRKNRRNRAAQQMKDECEEFFLSGYFNLWTQLDGKALLEMLRKEEAGV